MRVLVVEDYAPLRTSLVQALREAGHSVDACEDGAEALLQMQSEEYDIVVLDVMLPKVDGHQVLRRMRERGHNAHVLMLTARAEIEDRVRGLDLGADDYLVKPFAMQELLARVRALVRRGYVHKSPWIEVGHLRINTNSHAVNVAGEDIVLTAKEYALLEYLAMRCGEVVTRLDVWQHVYDERSNASSNVVDVYIGYLRKKVERKGLPKLIHTRRGEGYILSPESS